MVRRLAVCVTLGLAAVVASAADDAPVTGQIPITADTAAKPQSKLWYDQGTWWAALPQEKGVFLWRFADGKFTPQDVPGPLARTRADAQCDVCLHEGTLFVLSLQRNPVTILLHALKFMEGAWRELPGYPATLGYTGKISTVTCAVDGRGMLWAAYVSEDKKVLAHTFSPADPKAGFSKPIEVGVPGGPFDISSLRAFKGHVGVLWSMQKEERFMFRAHRDDKPADQWEPEEVVLAGKDMVNDHVNVTTDKDGNVWAVTKAQTGPTRPAAALVLSRRDASGKWTQVATIVETNQNRTRPIVVLDAEKPFAYVLYTDRVPKPWVIRMMPVSLADGKVGKEIQVLKTTYDLNNTTCMRAPASAATGLMIVAGAHDAKQGPAWFWLLKLEDLR